MTHTSAPAIASEPVSIPNQSFFGWLRTQTALFIGQVLALIGAVCSIAALAYYVGGLHVPPSFLKPHAISTIVIYSHLIFLTVFIIWLIKVLNDNQHGAYRSNQVHDRLIEANFGTASLTEVGQKRLEDTSIAQVRTFKIWFLLFWCAMLFLYFVFAIETKYGDFLHPAPTKDVVESHILIFPFLTFFANNLSMFFIFGCFVALYLPAGRRNPTQLSQPHVISDKEIVIQAAEHRRRQARLRFWFGLALMLFTAAYPLILWAKPLELTKGNWSDYPAIFNALSGTVNAVVVALLIARLDSKLIGLPPWLISILYFYSGVQPMFVVFEQPLDEFDAIRAVVLVVVFIFKLYFFLIILYSLQNGRLLNYFYCSPLLNQHIWKREVISSTKRPPKFQRVTKPVPRKPFVLKNKHRAQVNREAKFPVHHYQTKLYGLLGSLRSFGSLALSHLHRFYLEVKERIREVIHWLSERLLVMSKVLGWLGIIYFVLSLLYFAMIFCSREKWGTSCFNEPRLFSPDLKLLIIYSHLPLLLVIISSLIWMRRRSVVAGANSKALAKTKAIDSVSQQARNRLIQFQRFFLIFWCIMFVFYIAYAIKQYRDPSIPSVQKNSKDVDKVPSSDHNSHTIEQPISVLCDDDEQVAQRLDHQLHEDWTPLVISSGGYGQSNLSSSAPCSSILIEAHSRVTVKNLKFARKHLAEQNLAPNFILVQPPAKDPAKDKTLQAQALQDSAWLVGYSVITFLLNNLMVLFVFLCFSVLYLSVEDRHGSEKYNSLRNYAILVCILITAAIPLLLFSLNKTTMTIANPAVATTVVAAVGGVLNAVAFALLFARLDSRLIRLPSSVISVLYAYAALQPLFVVFERGTPVFSAIETSALGAAFIFKICFVLVIFHALRKECIEYHLEQFPLLNSRVNSIFDNQFEIRMFKSEKQFKYSIFKEDTELYRAIDPVPTREECDTAVTNLLTWMKDRKNYVPAGPVQGTYWVQVKKPSQDGAPEKVLCESKDLRSEEEVTDLIEECVEKVPYCKYRRD